MAVKMRNTQYAACARRWAGLVVGVVWWALLGSCQADVMCPRQHLVWCYPPELGVTHVNMMGTLSVPDEAKDPFTVTLHAFVKLRRTASGDVHLYGMGWVELTKMNGVQPAHRTSNNALPAFYLIPMESDWSEGSNEKYPVQIDRTDITDQDNKGFRLSAMFTPQNPNWHYYQLYVDGWQRRFPLEVSIRPSSGLIHPWRGMAPHAMQDQMWPEPGHVGHRARHASPAAEQDGPLILPGVTNPPLVVVVSLSTTQGKEEAGHIHQAQQLIRHVEYHLVQLGMQRYIIYIYEFVFHSPAFHSYLSRHLPPHLLPYITFVLWDSFPITDYHLMWQIIHYYHATVAVWGHGGVMTANIDLDEYIAFSGPPATLHQALERCNANQVDLIFMYNMMCVCTACMAKYNTDERSDAKAWAALQNPLVKAVAGGNSNAISGDLTPSKSGWPCAWTDQDPLLMYDRVWNETVWLAEANLVGLPTLAHDRVWANRGKLILRGEAVKTYAWHEGELLNGPGREVHLEPGACPYLLHLPNLGGYRGGRFGANIKYFETGSKPEWWLLESPKWKPT